MNNDDGERWKIFTLEREKERMGEEGDWSNISAQEKDGE